MSDWLTVEEASKKSGRSTHTIYSWIYESKRGRTDRRLDCRAKVFADRKKWIQDWVAEGKTLGRVKAVFDTSLHSEIEDLYWQAVAEAEGAAML